VETDRAFSDNSWITPLPSGVDPAMIRLARRGHRKTEARDHIKGIRGLTGRFGRFFTRHAAFGLRSTGIARMDVIGIPVSILRSGDRSVRALMRPRQAAARPLDSGP